MWFANPGWRTQSRAALDATAAAPWTPASLGAALIAWYKADAGVYNDAGTTLATNGQSVQQWNDQSGSGYHLKQATIGLRPTFLTATLNGLPVIDFQVGHFFQTVSQPVLLGVTNLSAFFLNKVTSISSGGRVIGISTPANADLGADVAVLEYLPTITTPTTYNSGTKSTGTIVSGSWNQIGTIFDGTNNIMYIANAAQSSIGATPTFAAAVDIEVFSDAAGGGTPTGQGAEIILTNTALSSTDRNNLATYLTGRWGI